ncbi:hypothetical protein ABPG75_009055 [Micractinium tetrahymenae]
MATCRAALASGQRSALAGVAPLAVQCRWRSAAQRPFTTRLCPLTPAAAPGESRSAVDGSSISTLVPDSASAAAAASTASAAGGDTSPSYVPPHFSDLPLNRSGGLRSQEQQLQQLLSEPSTRVLLLHRGRLLVAPAAEASSGGTSFGPPQLSLQAHSFAKHGAEAPDGGPPRWVPLAASPQQLQPGTAGASSAAEEAAALPDLLFLGVESSGAAVFACQVPAHLLPLLPSTDSSPQEKAACGLRFVDVRSEGQRMAGPDAAVAALAAGLVQWHASAAFCSRTGAPMRTTGGGHSRTPAAPATDGRRPRSVYPRIDPAVIVAVGCGDWLLLGRKASWAEGRYSCLAGFAEVGETLEQAVAREVMEESGVPVDLARTRYHSSQPWPFPSSLMIGFIAEAAQQGSAAAGSTSGGGNDAAGISQPPARGLQLLQGPALSAALDVGLKPAEAERYLLPQLPAVQVDPAELEDARWFHADWLAAATGMGGQHAAAPAAVRAASSGADVPFRIPGRYALASRLIRSWLEGRRAARAADMAAELGEQPASAAAVLQALAAIPDVDIDEGSFKYVLLRLSTPDGLHSKLLVRGDARAAYHNHVLQATAAEVRAAAPEVGLRLETVGGGRIEHYPEQRAAAVYGYSAAFGQAPHHVTAALLRRWLPFHEVTASYDGY